MGVQVNKQSVCDWAAEEDRSSQATRLGTLRDAEVGP